MSKIPDLNLEETKKYLSTQDIDSLYEIFSRANDYYHNKGKEYIRDEQFDLLKEIIKSIDKNFEEVVGFIPPQHLRVKLPKYLGSLDKVKPTDSKWLDRWIKKYDTERYVVSDKLDGVSCLYQRKKGMLKLFTRGDGVEGTDITHISKYLNLPDIDEDITIRGEIIMRNDVFEKSYKELYANPRNMVAGIINSKKYTQGINDIDFITYEILPVKAEKMTGLTKQLSYLHELGFNTVNHSIVSKLSIENLLAQTVTHNKDNPYSIDGIVIQPDIEYKRNTSKNPKYAFAFKVNKEEDMVEANVLDVEWNVTKWKVLKPRVKLDTVEMKGVKITYATGHNAKYIKDNNIGPGAVIKLTRSGDVIPYIVSVLRKTEAKMPEIDCEWNETGVDLIVKEEGDDIKIKKLVSFFKSLSIKYVSEATVKKLYENGFNTVFKILGATVEELMEIDTFKEKSSQRIVDNISKRMQDVEFYELCGAYGIFGFGISKRKLKPLFDSIPELLEFDDEEDLRKIILEVEGFSEKSCDRVLENIEQARKFKKKISKYVKEGKEDVKEGKEDVKEGKLRGMNIVFSGFRDKDLEKIIINSGGKIYSGISKKVDLLITKDSSKTSSKINKARDLGIDIVNKEDFFQLLR